ncbi:hypothetical protein [Shinella sp.]|jgi:hypothetical protein|uniref:hypothetical protein n=1 Tax=Shinella sp. TaxID=1870904 RepID=UPI003F7124AB
MLPGLSAAGMMMAGNRKPAFRNLAALFAGGADGVMIDLTDKTTLFNDPNGTFPVVNNGDPVGLALDQHKWGGKTLAEYRASQPELVTNGDFATDVSGWNLAGASGTITWQAGRMRVTATTNSTPGASRAFTCVIGRWYELSIDIPVAHSNYTSYNIGTGPASGNTYTSGNIGNAPGSYKRFFKAAATTQYVIVYGPGVGGQYIEVDNISIKEIDGHHATQTSTARPTWASATNDVLFDGTNDYLSVGDFDFPTGDCFLAAWAKSNTQNRAIAGVVQSSIYMALFHQTGGLLYSAVGSSTPMTGAVTSGGVYHTLLADKNAANANFVADGVVEATKATPGSTATTGDMAIGGWNSTGTPSAFLAGNVKRIVAGQVRVQDTMSAADFHENLIAA